MSIIVICIELKFKLYIISLLNKQLGLFNLIKSMTALTGIHIVKCNLLFYKYTFLAHRKLQRKLFKDIKTDLKFLGFFVKVMWKGKI